MSKVDRYAVMGNPIGHSKSPQIHSLFARQTGQDLEYSKQQVEEGHFSSAVQDFFIQGKGLNITVPFKQEAWLQAQQLSERARLAGAVNTLWINQAGELVGDNTDGAGLVTDLVKNQKVALTGKRLLLLGAGGAARGVIQPLLAEKPVELVIANRTQARAQELQKMFTGKGAIEALPYDQLSGPFDVIINATSASLQGDVPPLPKGLVTRQTTCYDMMYGAEPTAFNLWAERQGAKACIDGLGMLVEQAAEAFFCWRGVRPDTQPVLQVLRTELAGN
ncbi:shikimate dehydrogenase [Aestuariirhabdus sp. Z084]|uniref:shikimate dehydrogenase n=1 Tax=Aestuariirhabdus haliotis TaxID=2918751 RepID=UPI00201B36CB|nr:shikimate dehydrogenase [Aestuariirhabdus haliotis]MCL6414263.1 shikimate dehydrogenase [Aestuariirhabdus haliotis]MCL6418195.1 shikimate dehydrogenase [Aestuariirhabdus haliotis]